MDSKLKKLAVGLVLAALVASFLNVGLNAAFSADFDGRIDLFTQKEPFSGRGVNATSDAFGPGEDVQIYAYVSYNHYQVPGVLVAFEIQGPPNEVENITLYRTAFTNETGIATVCYRIPHDVATAFGNWTVVGNVVLNDIVFTDVLFFRAGWIVEIISVRTVDEHYALQDKFTKERQVGVEVGVKSISMIEKIATLTVALKDELDYPLNSSELRAFLVPPNETLIYTYFFLYLPKNATIGAATAYACAYTLPVSNGGVPYCPEVSKQFWIIYRDVAVISVKPSSESAYQGETVFVDVGVRNRGAESESFNVSAYHNGTLISMLWVADLQPDMNTELRFAWDTSSDPTGLYLVSAVAASVPDEIDVSDNILHNGYVEIKNRPPPIVHDVTVINIVPSTTMVYVGDMTSINVVVKNVGDFVETFNVTLHYDTFSVGTIYVNDLASQAEKTLTFHWNTQGLPEQTFVLSAVASAVPNEENLANNRYIDGTVTLRNKPAPVHDIAVQNIVPSSRLVRIGETLDVSITVRNKGTVAESFNVVLYYEQNVAGTQRVNNLAEGVELTLVFHWNTERVAKGVYTLIAFAEPVPGERVIADNYFEDGDVTFISGQGGLFGLDWYFWFFLLLLLLVILILFLLWLYYRRRKKKSEQTFNSGWTAWYYAYDPRARPRKASKTSKTV